MELYHFPSIESEVIFEQALSTGQTINKKEVEKKTIKCVNYVTLLNDCVTNQTIRGLPLQSR